MSVREPERRRTSKQMRKNVYWSFNIKVKSTPIFGGTSNKVKTVFNENLPTIYINSVAMFGGVEIK